MINFFKIHKFIFFLVFLYSCGSVGEALQGKKRSDEGDEFLINKKNPLVMPPDFDKLPMPGETNIKSKKNIDSDEFKIKDLLKKNTDEDGVDKINTETSIESSILKKIK